jgi:hypothetical protein
MLRTDGFVLQAALVQRQWRLSWQFDHFVEMLGDRYC